MAAEAQPPTVLCRLRRAEARCKLAPRQIVHTGVVQIKKRDW
jgi:hypothetical protein